ncbi:MAG: DUF58 domain-containing protein [Coxiellaceae bacterium]|nr:DUF58 domain-containing protein [Coxiellaceae bacterium]
MLPFLKKRNKSHTAPNDSGTQVSLDELLRLRFLCPSIELYSHQHASSHHIGGRQSNARGRGMEFDEVRDYQPGDDIRLINWQMTARMGRPFTKIYKEEREKPTFLVVDQSSSMHFGTRVAFKSVVAAKIAGLLAWSVYHYGDQIGGVVFNENQQHLIPPKRTKNTLVRLLTYLRTFCNQISDATSMQHSLQSSLQLLIRKRVHGSLIIAISDFYACDEQTLAVMGRLAERNDVVVYFVYDRLERYAPQPGQYVVSDGENTLQVDLSTANHIKRYTQQFAERLAVVKKYCQSHHIRFNAVCSEDDWVKKVSAGVSHHG